MRTSRDTVVRCLLATLFFGAAASAGHAVTASCGGLRSLSLPHATITAAEAVSSGTFVPPASALRSANAPLSRLPAFCPRDGYANAATDTGHAGNNARFAVGHPEKLADHGYRAVHEMTVAAKRIIATRAMRATASPTA